MPRRVCRLLLNTHMHNTQGQTYDNLVGLLWNVGLLDTNQPLLAAAGAPPHLSRPIPARWVWWLCVRQRRHIAL